MMYLGDFPTGATVYLPFNTNGADGHSITIATDGTLKVYKLPGLTQRTSAAGITFSEDFDAITGRHLVALNTSDDTDVGFYAAGNDFGVCRDAMTIDGITVNAWLGMFSIENRSALRPTVPGRTVDVTAGGAAAVDATIPTVGEIANEVQTRTIAAVTTVTVVNTVAPAVVTAIWAAASRSLTTFGSLVTDTATAVVAALSSSFSSIGATVLNSIVEGAITVGDSLRLANSANAGKTSGMATGTAVIRDLADTKARITASVDADGNRTAVTRDVT